MRRHRLTVPVALLALVLAVTGCDFDFALMREFIIDFGKDWLLEHAAEIALYEAWGSSGNDEVDAVLGAKEVVTNLIAADKLMEEGRAEGDLGKMDEAVSMRPDDYSYRVSYGVALLGTGRADEAEAQFDAGGDAAQNQGQDFRQDYAIRGIEELSVVGEQWEKNGFPSKAQCQTYYSQMADLYAIRVSTGDEYFNEQRERFLALAKSCK